MRVAYGRIDNCGRLNIRARRALINGSRFGRKTELCNNGCKILELIGAVCGDQKDIAAACKVV